STNAARKSIPCACVRIPTSSSCTSTSSPLKERGGDEARGRKNRFLSRSPPPPLSHSSLRFIRRGIVRTAIQGVPTQAIHLVPTFWRCSGDHGDCCRL